MHDVSGRLNLFSVKSRCRIVERYLFSSELVLRHQANFDNFWRCDGSR